MFQLHSAQCAEKIDELHSNTVARFLYNNKLKPHVVKIKEVIEKKPTVRKTKGNSSCW
jgi:hypothetical protein